MGSKQLLLLMCLCAISVHQAFARNVEVDAVESADEMNDKFADDGDEENEDDSFPDEDKELNDEAVMEDLQDNEEKDADGYYNPNLRRRSGYRRRRSGPARRRSGPARRRSGYRRRRSG